MNQDEGTPAKNENAVFSSFLSAFYINEDCFQLPNGENEAVSAVVCFANYT